MESIEIIGDSGKDALDKLRDLLEDARESFGGGDCHIMIENNKIELIDDYGNVYYEISF